MKGVATCLLALLGARVQGFGYFVGMPDMDVWGDVGKCYSLSDETMDMVTDGDYYGWETTDKSATTCWDLCTAHFPETAYMNYRCEWYDDDDGDNDINPRYECNCGCHSDCQCTIWAGYTDVYTPSGSASLPAACCDIRENQYEWDACDDTTYYHYSLCSIEWDPTSCDMTDTKPLNNCEYLIGDDEYEFITCENGEVHYHGYSDAGCTQLDWEHGADGLYDTCCGINSAATVCGDDDDDGGRRLSAARHRRTHRRGRAKK